MKSIKRTISMELRPFLKEVNGRVFCIAAKCDNTCTIYKNCKIVSILKKESVIGDTVIYKGDSSLSVKKEEVFCGKKTTLIDKGKFSELRSIGKIVGLALIYGCSAYTISSNIGVSLDVAEERKDSFFENLPKVREYMLHVEQEVIKTGKVRNMFGRVRDVSKWAFSQAETARKQMQDRGYAIRTALNHPIQSSMAEVLKLAMLRADDFISNNKYYPLAGLTVPQNISGKTYLDFLCCMLLSIHDEIDFLLRTDLFDSVIPPLYRVLQVRDIIKSLGVDFCLEMDVEYDSSRSFTAAIKYPAAKVFLYNEVLNSPEVQPNILLINLSDITPEILAKFKESRENTGNTFFVGVKQLNSVLVLTNRQTEGFLQGLGLSFQKGYLPLNI